MSEEPKESDSKCIVCGSKISIKHQGLFDTRFGIKDKFEIGHCSICGINQILPLPSIKSLNELYESHYNFGSEKGTIYTFCRELFFSSIFYQFWLIFDGDIAFHRKKGVGRLIDIGCNEGRGLKVYCRNGFEAQGFELNTRAVQNARSEGFTVYTQPLEKFQPDKHFDIVVLSNVLEHVSNPQKMLDDVHRLLKPDGHVWISCPNSHSWLRQLFGPFWINWHVPFHLFHFSPKALGQLLARSGFEVKKIKFVTPSHWLTQSIIASIFAKPGKETRQLRNPLLVAFLMLFCWLFFPILWIGNITGHGDCLVVEAVPRNKS